MGEHIQLPSRDGNDPLGIDADSLWATLQELRRQFRVIIDYQGRLDCGWQADPEASGNQLRHLQEGTDKAVLSVNAVIDLVLARQSLLPSHRLTKDNADDILSPGRHPCDPVNSKIDPLAFVLEKLRSNLAFIDQYRSTFESLRGFDSEQAAREASHLRDAVSQANAQLNRLIELLSLGYLIDVNKQAGKSLRQPLRKR